MKNKLIAIVLSILLLVGLLVGIRYYQGSQKDKNSKSIDTYNVKKMDDVILDGVVKSTKKVKLDDTTESDLFVKNGDHVNKGDLIYKSGYVAPESGTFSINSNGTYSIISDSSYVSSKVPEYNKSLIKQGQAVKVWSIDNSKHSDGSMIRYVGVDPVEESDNLSYYQVKASIKDFITGTHVKIHIPNNKVYIPANYVENNYIIIKKPNSKVWKKEKVKLIKQDDTLYADISTVPAGSQLKKE